MLFGHTPAAVDFHRDQKEWLHEGIRGNGSAGRPEGLATGPLPNRGLHPGLSTIPRIFFLGGGSSAPWMHARRVFVLAQPR